MSSPGAGYLGEGIGAGMIGGGLAVNPQLENTNLMQYLPGDQQAIGQQQQQQQGMNQQYMNSLNQNANQDYQNLTSQLSPSGGLGQQLAGEYNNYGITPQSGAFQEGLGNQYGQMMQNVNQQQAGALGQGYQEQSSLGNLGLQQQFGLEGQQGNVDLAQNLARFGQQTGLQNALIGGGANVAGQGASQGK